MEQKPRILRRPELKERTGLSNAQRDRLEAAGKFPRRVLLSERAVGWHSDEIDDWIQSRPRAELASRQAQAQ